MESVSFQGIIVLRLNEDLWDEHDVAEAMQRSNGGLSVSVEEEDDDDDCEDNDSSSSSSSSSSDDDDAGNDGDDDDNSD
jgi:hypothetical protein